MVFSSDEPAGNGKRVRLGSNQDGDAARSSPDPEKSKRKMVLNASLTLSFGRQVVVLDEQQAAAYREAGKPYLPREEVMDLPAFSLKAIIDILPAFRGTVVVQTVIKDCSVNAFLSSVLQKARAVLGRTKIDWSDILLEDLALVATNSRQPIPLTLNRKSRNMKEQLIDLGVPFPFVLTVIKDPAAVLRKKQEEQKLVEEEIREEARRQVVCEIQARIQLAERAEALGRAVIAMRSTAQAERLHWQLLMSHRRELEDVVDFQLKKEEHNLRDELSDKEFFANLREVQAAQMRQLQAEDERRAEYHRQRLSGCEIESLQVVERLGLREERHRAVLMLVIFEEQTRIQLQVTEDESRNLLRCIAAEQKMRMQLRTHEALRFRQWKEKEAQNRLDILTSDRRQRGALRKQRHDSDLRKIVARLNTEVSRSAELDSYSDLMLLPLENSRSSFMSTTERASTPASGFRTSLDHWGHRAVMPMLNPAASEASPRPTVGHPYTLSSLAVAIRATTPPTTRSRYLPLHSESHGQSLPSGSVAWPAGGRRPRSVTPKQPGPKSTSLQRGALPMLF